MKYAKSTVKYTSDHGTSNEQCSKCIHFRAPGSCNIVEGSIDPEGWCDQFHRKSEAAK